MQVGVGYANRTMTLRTTLQALAKASNSWLPTLSQSISLPVLARQQWTTCPSKSEPASPEKSSTPPSLPVARSSKPPLPPIPSFRCISKSTTKKNNVGINFFAPRFFFFQILAFSIVAFPPFLHSLSIQRHLHSKKEKRERSLVSPLYFFSLSSL